MRTLIKIILMICFISGISLPQRSVFITNQNGMLKSYNPIAPYLSSQDPSLKLRTTPLNVSSSKINTIFEMDSLDLFNPNLYLFATTKSFNALDDGSGKKILYGIKSDTGAGTITSYFFNTSNYNVIGSFSDTSYKKIFYTQSDFFPFSDPNKLNFLVGYVGSNVPSLGSPLTKIYDNVNGNSIMNFNYGTKGESAYFVSNVPSSDSYPKLDLNNNGLNEIVGVSSLGLFNGWRLYIYDNLSIIDSIDETRTSLFSALFTTSADLNGDGIPEIVSCVNGSPQFFQWNASTKKFQSLATLPSLSSMYLVPENVDGNSSNEIVTQGGAIGDSIYVFDNKFNLKYGVMVPGMGIKKYFIKSVTGSSNKQIIAVSPVISTGLTNGTFIYDLSKGTNPIWADSTFEAIAIGDFMNDGKNRILGFKDSVYSNGWQKAISIEMVSYSGSTFTTDWKAKDTATYSISLAGPFTPSDWTSVSGLSFFGPGSLMDLKMTDLNGDGKNKFLFNIITFPNPPTYIAKSYYILVNSDGEIVDTLSGPYKDCYALAGDLNNDGHDELLVTQLVPPDLLFPDTALVPRAWVFEYGGGTTGIKNTHQLISNYKLEQNYPNPFNPSTTINYEVPSSGRVVLKVYDILGREVESLVNENKSAGKYSVSFNADKLASGVYFYKMQAGQYYSIKKMILLK